MLAQQLPWTELESSEAAIHGSSKINSQTPPSNPSNAEPFLILEKLDQSLSENQEAQDISPSSENHICKFCKKQFLSGSALGGHMRAHGSVFIQSEASPSRESNPDKELLNSPQRYGSCVAAMQEMESNSEHTLGSSESSLSPSEGDCIAVANSLAMEEFLRADNEAASVKGSGNYSDLEAAEDGSLACDASDSDSPSRRELGLRKEAQQLYTLRRNPRPSKRFKDEEYAMEMVASAAARKSTILMAKTEDRYECTECGKGFASSKALFGHMRCHPKREGREIPRPKGGGRAMDSKAKNPQSPSHILWQNSPSQSGDHTTYLISQNESDAESIEAAYMNGEFKPSLQSWMRGKRSKRSRQTIPLQKSEAGQLNTPLGIKEDTDMADCLVLLAYAGKVQEELDPAKKRAAFGPVNERERKEGSEDEEAKAEVKRDYSSDVWREESSQFEEFDEVGEDQEADGGLKYQCHSCKRVFKSHQALGGHRASHRKVKGCFARAHASERWPYRPEEDLLDPNQNLHTRHLFQGIDGENAKANKLKKRSKSGQARKIKAHECSICHKIFQSGQALGGHKRCHWGGAASSDTSAPHSFSQKLQIGILEKDRSFREELLDLNQPAPEEEADDPTLDFKPTSITNPSTFNPSKLDPSKLDPSKLDPSKLDPTKLDPSKLDPNISTLIENCPPGDGDHNIKCSASSSKFSKLPSNFQAENHAAQDVGSGTQAFMLSDRADSSAFHPWYVQHSIYDQVSTSIPTLKNIERNYTTTIAAVAGLTPISA